MAFLRDPSFWVYSSLTFLASGSVSAIHLNSGYVGKMNNPYSLEAFMLYFLRKERR